MGQLKPLMLLLVMVKLKLPTLKVELAEPKRLIMVVGLQQELGQRQPITPEQAALVEEGQE